jgi:hypothetical protein
MRVSDCVSVILLLMLLIMQVVAQVSASVVERAHFLLSLPCTVTATPTTAAAAHGHKSSDGTNGWQVSCAILVYL